MELDSSEVGGLRVWRDTGLKRGNELHLTVDGEPVVAYAGETVAVALLAAGRRTLRVTAERGEARGIFCGMGVCYDCLVVIDGQPSERACMVEARDGMSVEIQVGVGE